MSYALAWAPEARQAWGVLEFDVQEQILDQLASIVAAEARDIRPSGVVDFETKSPAMRAVVFLLLAVSHARREVTVTQLGFSPVP